MAICDDSIESDLVEIGRLQLQHLMDAFSIDLVRCVADFIRSAITTSEPSADKLFAVFIQPIKGRKMGARGYFDQLGETVPDLCRGQAAEECEV